MGVCPATHFVMLRGTEHKLGMGIGPQVLRAYIQSKPIKGHRSLSG